MTNTTISMPYANNRFEEAAIKLIANARTFEEGRERFNGACMRCALYARQSDCGNCPIRETLLAMADGGGWKKMKKEDYFWVELERAAE